MYNSSFLDNLSDKENNQPNEQNNNSKINLDDIILALEFAIDDINKEENKFYIIQEIENVIMKLKKLSKNLSIENGANLQESKNILLRPPSSGVTTIELTKNLKAKYNYSPLRPQRKNSQDFSTNSCVSNISTRLSKVSNKSNIKSKNNYINGQYSSSSNTRSPIRNSHSPPSIFFIILMVIDMKAISKKEIMKEKGYFILIMGIDMKEILKKINILEKEFIIIIMGIILMDIGWMIKNMEKVYIIIKMEIKLLENIIMENLMEHILNILMMEKSCKLITKYVFNFLL